MKKKLIHTPEGFRDIFGIECDRKRYLERRIEKLYRSYGYQSIETPAFEFFRVFSEEVGTTSTKDLYKVIDRDGSTLVLRPDFTPSVARSVSMYFAEEDMPLRFCYHGNVYRNNHSLQGRLRESTQMGVEYLNDDSAEADAEVIALVVRTMKRAGLENFQVSIGHVGYFHSLVKEADLDSDTVDELRTLLKTRNRFGAQELIEGLPISDKLKNAFNSMTDLYGGRDVLDRAEKSAVGKKAEKAIARLRKIDHVLDMYGLRDYVMYDLGMVTEYKYYTGIIFQAYTYGSGDALISGGRYNRLIEHFGKKAAAVGFAADIDSLLTAIERQKLSLPVTDIKIMILYPEKMEKEAVHYADRLRDEGNDAACVRFDDERELSDYIAYGKRNQFREIRYFSSKEDAKLIRLNDGSEEMIASFAEDCDSESNDGTAVRADRDGMSDNTTMAGNTATEKAAGNAAAVKMTGTADGGEQ